MFDAFPVDRFLGPARGTPFGSLGLCQSRHLVVRYLEDPTPNGVPRFGGEGGQTAIIGGRDKVEFRLGVVGSEEESGVGGDTGDPIGVEERVVGEIERGL